MKMNMPILMSISLDAFDKGGKDAQVVMSPIMFAAWLGFLITFLNLLPAWQLDGGHMARSLYGTVYPTAEFKKSRCKTT